MPSPAVPLSGENEATVGAPGATVSTVTFSAAEAALTLPAASIALVVKAWLPSASVRGRKGPGAAGIRRRGADLGRAVEHLDRAAGGRRARQGDVVGVGDAVAAMSLSGENEATVGAVGTSGGISMTSGWSVRSI